MRNDREENGKFPLHSSTPLKISRDFVELFEGGFEVVNDFLGEYVGLGKIVGLYEAFVFEAGNGAECGRRS
jgi:hypothetical protein